ncbi:MAG: sensor histidine kinase [Acidobacteriota bacterium]|nr:sensor histidine kinase [Acidobacteriota bacterium]
MHHRAVEFDAILAPAETRWTFRAYAILTAAVGLVLFLWGPRMAGGGSSLYTAPLIRAASGVLIAVACFTWPLASIADPSAARRALIGFGAGHVALFLVLLTQRAALGNPRQADALLTGILFLGFVFSLTQSGLDRQPPANAGLTTLSIFGKSTPASSVETLRRRYQHQIREAALQEERHRLARDLHDSVKQQIFAIQTSAAAVQARFEGDPAGARAALEQVRSSARQAMAEMEAMLDQLRAAPLERAGLISALRQQCEALGFRSGAAVDFEAGTLPSEDAVSPGAQEALFRIAQEALSNVARHARAARVTVRLGVVANQLQLSVEDNGSGFDASQPESGMGIANMRVGCQNSVNAKWKCPHRRREGFRTFPPQRRSGTNPLAQPQSSPGRGSAPCRGVPEEALGGVSTGP